MPQICDIEPMHLLLSKGMHAEDIFALKNSKASAGFETTNLGKSGQPAKPYTTEAALQGAYTNIFKTYKNTMSNKRTFVVYTWCRIV
jgi:hypothetical protein